MPSANEWLWSCVRWCGRSCRVHRRVTACGAATISAVLSLVAGDPSVGAQAGGALITPSPRTSVQREGLAEYHGVYAYRFAS